MSKKKPQTKHQKAQIKQTVTKQKQKLKRNKTYTKQKENDKHIMVYMDFSFAQFLAYLETHSSCY